MDYFLAQVVFIKRSFVSEFLFAKEAVAFSFFACYASVSFLVSRGRLWLFRIIRHVSLIKARC